MTDITICKINESFLEVKACEDILSDLWARYSAYKAGYQFNPKFKNKIWDGKIHLFNIRSGVLPIGFLTDLLGYAKIKGYTFDFENIVSTDLKQPLDENEYTAQIEENMKTSGMTIRPYQDEAVRKALTYKKGILLSCTGSGKSLMIYNAIRCLQAKGLKKILLVVPNIILIDQMYDDLTDYGGEEYGECLSTLGGGHKADFSKPVLISTWESLQYKDADFFEDFDAVFVDECHGSKAMKLCNIIKFCTNAQYKIGTTGTLPTDPGDQLVIKSLLGEVIFELKSKELIDLGVLTKIQIGGIYLKYPEEFIAQNRGREYQEEVRMVESYPGRNNVLKMIIDHTPDNHNILVLVNHIKHIEDVTLWINDNYPNRKVSVISGAVKGKDRARIRTNLENEDGTILVATYATMSTGVNIPKLHEVVLYANCKSKIKVLQSIGRGLRKHATKDKIMLYDVIDDLSYQTNRGRVVDNYLVKHFKERCAYYKEQEFPIVTMSLSI